MTKCPAGYDMDYALRSACNSCAFQCIILKLKREIEELKHDIKKLKEHLD